MTVTSRHLLGLLVVLSAMAGCKRNDLNGVSNELRFDPPSLEFDPAFADGITRQREVTIVNDGRATVEVSWDGIARPFAIDLPTRLPPGATTLIVAWTPEVPGRFSQLLEVHADGLTSPTLPLDAAAHELPPCVPSSPCVASHFDPASQACVEEPVEDGLACDPGTLCLVDARCEAGRCVGTARTCEDDNRCTIDVCYPMTGCEFLPSPPCPGDGACLEGTCDPATGCGLQPREDGSSCGRAGSCTMANVCIEGTCVTRDPPDGFVCAEESPCSGEGRCVNDTCVRSASPQGTELLLPNWSYDTVASADLDAGMTPSQLHDFVLEPGGEMSLSGFFHTPAVLRANTAEALTAPLGSSRRCILWNTKYVCADYPASPNGKVSAMDLATGATAWTFDIRTARPDFLMTAPTIFLARLVVQDSDRLAALFEAYPRNTANDTQCRRYFLAVINASGQLVQAQQVIDPLLDVCNHPHAYGVAADSGGNLFIAFSPTVSQQAPLVPDDTTLITSFSRDGVFRWKRLNGGMRGGELAVARGLLYAEYTSVVLDATSGQPVFALPTDLGRAVISQSRLIPAPVAGSTTLSGFEAGALQLRWSAVLPGPWTFWSDQVRLAKWQTSKGPRTVALTFVQAPPGPGLQSQYGLYAFDVQDGSEAFNCPVVLPARTPPQLFEVANGSLGIMSGALDSLGNPGCSKCDPPLAGSAGAFFSVPTRLISVADEPWVGTFGGAGHDHREN
ncbi:MAG: tenascin-X [Archangium sp.]|nr:tenascin-X [Archangium sp.]